MAAPQIVYLQFYRQEPGDIGISDIPISGTQDAERTLRNALLGYFNNPNIVPHQRAHHARAVTADDSVILTLMATGPKSVERI